MFDEIQLNFYNRSGEKVRKSCRSRRELSNEYLLVLANIGIDTAENGPPKVCQKFKITEQPKVRKNMKKQLLSSINIGRGGSISLEATWRPAIRRASPRAAHRRPVPAPAGRGERPRSQAERSCQLTFLGARYGAFSAKMQTAGTLPVPSRYPPGTLYISPGPNFENPAKIRQNLGKIQQNLSNLTKFGEKISNIFSDF